MIFTTFICESIATKVLIFIGHLSKIFTIVEDEIVNAGIKLILVSRVVDNIGSGERQETNLWISDTLHDTSHNCISCTDALVCNGIIYVIIVIKTI